MLDLKKVMLPIMLVILLITVLPYPEARAEGITVSVEFGYGKKGREARIGFQVEGWCTEITAKVQYDPHILKYDDYNPFWGKFAKVTRLEEGILKIEAKTNYPVPRRSQVLQLRFIAQEIGETQLTIIKVKQAKYHDSPVSVTRKRHGRFQILK